MNSKETKLARVFSFQYNQTIKGEGVVLMQYENVEKLDRQAMIFVAIHTLLILNFALDFGFLL